MASKAAMWAARLSDARWAESGVKSERPALTRDGVHLDGVGWVSIEVDDGGHPVFVVPARDERGNLRYVLDDSLNIGRLLKACRAILDTFGEPEPDAQKEAHS